MVDNQPSGVYELNSLNIVLNIGHVCLRLGSSAGQVNSRNRLLCPARQSAH